jgi:hypothetical protein
MAKKKITVDANVEYAELQGIVTVGAESAALLSKKLGRKVEVGEQFDLGTLAIHYKNPWKNFWANLKIRKHIFNN